MPKFAVTSFCTFICILTVLLHSAASTASPLIWPTNKTLHSTKSASLVELYTSQGCSSCPPAERYLNKFEHNDALWRDIVPVAFHVDYWDHLGWKDPYASPLFSQRQRAYRKNKNIKSVYTPGFVVNGQEWRGYYFGKSLPTMNNNSHLTLSFTGTQLHAILKTTTENTQNNTQLTFNMAILGVGIRTPIERGENSHRTLEQDFTVLQHQQYTSQNGEWVIQPNIDNIPPSPRYAVAFWVQNNRNLNIIHATGSWL